MNFNQGLLKMPPKNTVKLLGYHFADEEKIKAWSRIARETGAEYLALKLDHPSFRAPVYASLVQSDKGEHKLI